MKLKYNFFARFEPFGDRVSLNKYLKKLLKILNFFNFLFVFPFFKIFKIRMLNSSLEAIGHQIMDLELMNYLNDFKDFKILILSNHKFIGNRFFLYNYQNYKNIIKVENYILCTLLFYLKKYKTLCLDVHHYSTKENSIIYKYFEKIPKKKINFEHSELAKEILQRKKIQVKKNFVCIHVRNSFLKKYDKEDIRNAKIETFNETINWLLKANYTVVFLGEYGSIEYKFNHENLIDITSIKLSKNEKNIVDLYLCANCYFYIGTQSGLHYLACYFNRPILLTNMIPLSHAHSINKNGISIPKLFRFKNTKKLLTFKEMIELNIYNERLQVNYEKKKYRNYRQY